MPGLSVAFRLTLDALCYFCIERSCLLLSYCDFLIVGNPALARIAAIHLVFLFRQSGSLLPDAAISLAATLNILAMIDVTLPFPCGVDLVQALFILAETVAFLFGRERIRQRRRRNFQPKLREPLLPNVRPPSALDGNDRRSRLSTGPGDFFVPYERDYQIHIVSFLQGTGDVSLVCLHQFGSGTFTFDRLAGALGNARDAFSAVYAFDRPAHGETSRPDRKELEVQNKLLYYSADCAVRITEFVVGEISALRGQNVVLLGCGQGALIALEVAATLRSQVVGLLLISPPTEDAEFAEGVPRIVKSAALTKVGSQISSALLKAELGDFLVKRAWFDPKSMPDDLLDKYRQVTHLPGWTDGITAYIRNYKKRDIHRRILQTKLIRSNLPVTVIIGNHDRVVQEPKAKEFTETLRVAGLAAELVVLKNCGHVPHEELPVQVADVVHDFMKTRIPSFSVLV